MGKCYFRSIYYQHRGEPLKEPRRQDLVIGSEELGMICKAPLHRVISATAGIFFYETDTWDIPALKRQLHKLVDEIVGE